MGCTRSHPLHPGIFVPVPTQPLTRSDPIPAWYNEAETIVASSEFVGWTSKNLDDEIDRLRKRLRELESERVQVKATHVDDEEYDSDDIMNDPDVRKMVENGEHICHMFDGECHACAIDEEDQDDEDQDDEDQDDEVRFLTEEEVENDPEMTAQLYKADHLRAQFC